MKEHKNHKVRSEGILWMVSAVEDFGVSHLKLKDLIDFVKEIGLQSSAAATRNASIKLLGVLHKFVVPGSIYSAQKTVRVSDSSSSVVAGGLDSLHREDISGKVTPTPLKSFESSDWKVRMESVDAVNKILEEANNNKCIQSIGTGDLFGAPRGRLNDSNKNQVMATLTTIGNVASAMRQAVEKSSKGILKCFGDNRKHMRKGVKIFLIGYLGNFLG
ncbi:protein MOR1-like isoform X3 [Trifolium pratense]|uniref:protein MOR1-like isoform X3 n=1 Tax=Trifolium pratense TaxID=57577 RepID=UPI001E697D5D|nr:protein MOR1-like isoform X3 [Trifolium pratense]XP_045825416.1 protein MOR1-like isoform X3 [Trifolium pratense]